MLPYHIIFLKAYQSQFYFFHKFSLNIITSHFDYSINKNSKWIKTEKIRIKWVVSKGKIKNIEETWSKLPLFLN